MTIPLTVTKIEKDRRGNYHLYVGTKLHRVVICPKIGHAVAGRILSRRYDWLESNLDRDWVCTGVTSDGVRVYRKIVR